MPANTRSSRSRDEEMPYHYEPSGLEFGVSGFSFDGGASGSPDYEDQEIELYKYGDWDEVTIDVNVTVNGSVEGVFPDEEGPPFPADLIVVVDCEETQLRSKKVVQESPVEKDTFETEITIQKELVRGTVVLTPRLVRTESCREGLPYAPNEGMRVAGGPTWDLLVDEPEVDADGFPFVYRDFSQEAMPSNELAHSFSRNPNPKMMINNQREGIVDVLQTGGTYGFRPNLKDVLKSEIGSMLWIQLVVLTGTTIAESDDTEFNWQDGVIEELIQSDFSDHLFEDADGYETVSERLGQSVSEAAELREFITDLCEAVQLYTDTADRWDYFVEEEAP
jgi:hypothetical protein